MRLSRVQVWTSLPPIFISAGLRPSVFRISTKKILETLSLTRALHKGLVFGLPSDLKMLIHALQMTIFFFAETSVQGKLVFIACPEP